ncbi:ABC transporter ATP-binding protein [Salinibacterium hongtaonis]|uniref:Sulfonate ABC transporter ATP-binding protein n=1 Tax=Homoserinimonas hongtaonis TaxID=2079791 RepID=A0A2U1T303_9MICO|nr:ABC transporter ATP-binding protein [Salinibacterium hongtaonis]PWB98238.1 sulfonate ABC transporter ATP-binding protein [Salinibacterium hongtaonis]
MTQSPPPAAISLTNARRIYGSGETEMVALNGVDLDIAPGRFVSVIGPSGCGKSTLLRLIAGLEQPDDGAVSVYGVTPEVACSAKMVGLVPQAPALLPWLNVLQNVSLPHKINKGADKKRPAAAQAIETASGMSEIPDMKELLRLAGLGEAMHKLPAELSGGMQQRTAIVRAFGLRPDVMLLDEPFSALDEFTRESLQEQLLDLWDEMKSTVVFVTHSVSEAVRLSDTVIVMAPNPGRIVDVIDIELARPRSASMIKTAAFHQYEDLIRESLQNAWRSPETQNAA